MTTATFRPATLQDIPLIQALAREIWHEHYPSIISRKQIDYMLARMYSDAQLTKDITELGYKYQIILSGPIEIGYLGYRYEPENRSVFLSKLYVLGTQRGLGIGQAALKLLSEFGKQYGADQIYLFVNKRNERAIRAYRRAGFSVTEDVVTQIGDGYVMDDHRMALAL